MLLWAYQGNKSLVVRRVMAKMSNCIFPCLFTLASEMFSLPLPVQKPSTRLRRRGYRGVQALQPVLLLEKTRISSRNKNTT